MPCFYYSAGITAYSGGDYQTAADQLAKAVESDTDGTNENYYNALYYLGFAYFNLGDRQNADDIFNQIIQKYPNQASQVQGYISGSSGGQYSDTTQGQASMENGGGDTGGQDITIYGNDGTAQSYDPADVAWTDPYTGLHYDMYGNLLG